MKTLNDKRIELEKKLNLVNAEIYLKELLELKSYKNWYDFQRDYKGHFFDSDTKRYFNSIVDEYIINGCFITSEKNGSEPRYYTIRTATPNIHSIGDFQGFATKKHAETFLRRLPLHSAIVMEIAITCWNIGDIKYFKKAMNKKALKEAIRVYLINGEYSSKEDFVKNWIVEKLSV